MRFWIIYILFQFGQKGYYENAMESNLKQSLKALSQIKQLPSFESDFYQLVETIKFRRPRNGL